MALKRLNRMDSLLDTTTWQDIEGKGKSLSTGIGKKTDKKKAQVTTY